MTEVPCAALQDSPADTPRRSPDELASEGDCGHRGPAEVPDHTGVERPPGTEAAGVRQVRRALHTAMADRALFSAIKADLTAFGRHLAILLGSALASRRRSEATQGMRTRIRDDGSVPRRGRMIVPLIKGIAVAALLAGDDHHGRHPVGAARYAHRRRAGAIRPAVASCRRPRTAARSGVLARSRTRRPESDFQDVLVNAVLSIEDRRFYRHVGIDPLRILRAARVNLDAGEIVEGGSTITQQLVKLRLVGRERTMERKLREAFAALWLNFRMDKDAILTEYLNRIYLGAGAYGVSAAASVFSRTAPARDRHGGWDRHPWHHIIEKK